MMENLQSVSYLDLADHRLSNPKLITVASSSSDKMGYFKKEKEDSPPEDSSTEEAPMNLETKVVPVPTGILIYPGQPIEDKTYSCDFCRVDERKYRALAIHGFESFSRHMISVHETIVVTSDTSGDGKPEVKWAACTAWTLAALRKTTLPSLSCVKIYYDKFTQTDDDETIFKPNASTQTEELHLEADEKDNSIGPTNEKIPISKVNTEKCGFNQLDHETQDTTIKPNKSEIIRADNDVDGLIRTCVDDLLSQASTLCVIDEDCTSVSSDKSEYRPPSISASDISSASSNFSDKEESPIICKKRGIPANEDEPEPKRVTRSVSHNLSTINPLQRITRNSVINLMNKCPESKESKDNTKVQSESTTTTPKNNTELPKVCTRNSQKIKPKEKAVRKLPIRRCRSEKRDSTLLRFV